jgi:hypothetical protein
MTHDTTNYGNTVRTFFRKLEISTVCTEINVDLSRLNTTMREHTFGHSKCTVL